MSHGYYNEKWKTSMKEYSELLEKELELHELGKSMPNPVEEEGAEDKREKNGYQFPKEQLYRFHAELYIRFLNLYKNLEECYDQTTHAQKGECIFKTLKLVIPRVLFHKTKLIHYSKIPGVNNFPPLDHLLIEMNLSLKRLNVSVPRFYKEEKVCPEANISLMYRIFNQCRESGELVVPAKAYVKVPEAPPLSKIEALSCLSRVEHWRQEKDQAIVQIEMKLVNRKIKQNLGTEQMQQKAAVDIQRMWKGYVTRKEVDQLFQEELAFYGLTEQSASQVMNKSLCVDLSLPDDLKPMPSDADDIRRRQKFRFERLIDYKRSRQEIVEELKNDQYELLKQEKKAKMWEWLSWKRQIDDEWPKSMKEYSDDYLEKYEEEKDKENDGEEEVEEKKGEKKGKEKGGKDKKDKKGGKKKGKDKKKKGKGKKKKKGKGDEMCAVFNREPVYKPPTKTVETMTIEVKEFNEIWSDKITNEDNIGQVHDVQIVRDELMKPLNIEIRKECRKEVQKQLNHIRMQLGLPVHVEKGKKKKGKKSKKKKGKKKKK